MKKDLKKIITIILLCLSGILLLITVMISIFKPEDKKESFDDETNIFIYRDMLGSETIDSEELNHENEDIFFEYDNQLYNVYINKMEDNSTEIFLNNVYLLSLIEGEFIKHLYRIGDIILVNTNMDYYFYFFDGKKMAIEETIIENGLIYKINPNMKENNIVFENNIYLEYKAINSSNNISFVDSEMNCKSSLDKFNEFSIDSNTSLIHLYKIAYLGKGVFENKKLVYEDEYLFSLCNLK